MRFSPLPHLAALALLCTGCSHDERSAPSLRILPHLDTRVTALNFEAGDCIGLRIDRSTGTYAENAPLTCDGVAFRSGSLTWYAGSDASTLTACHPYDAAGFPQRFAVAPDQTAGLTASDLLGARSERVVPTSSAVPMLFRHLLSHLTIATTGDGGPAVASLRLAGLAGTAVIDWETLTASAAEDAAPATILPRTVSAGGYEAILVPQEGCLTVSVTTAAGGSYERSVRVSLQGGKSYRLALTLTSEALDVSLAGEIEAWGDGGDPTVGGDPDEEDPAPVDPAEETLTVGTERYAVRRIGGVCWMAENLRSLPAEGMTAGMRYPARAGIEARTETAELGYLYDHATALRLCPAGWHLPTREELEALRTAATGTGFFREADTWRNQAGNEGYLKKSYLLGASDGAGKCAALLFSEAEGARSVATLDDGWAFSVRFVQD